MHRCAVDNQRACVECRGSIKPIARQKLFKATANDYDTNQLRLIYVSTHVAIVWWNILERDLELGKNAQNASLTQSLPNKGFSRVATSWIGTTPIAKTQTNFSSLTMCNNPFLQQIIYFMHVYSAYDTYKWTPTVPLPILWTLIR